MAKKSPKKQYVLLEYDMLHSREWEVLSLAARDVYVQIKASRNKRTARGKILNRSDDRIRFAHRDCNGMSKPTYHRAVKELISKGFIEVVDQGGMPNRKAAYALVDTWKVLAICQGMGKRSNGC